MRRSKPQKRVIIQSKYPGKKNEAQKLLRPSQAIQRKRTFQNKKKKWKMHKNKTSARLKGYKTILEKNIEMQRI